MINTGDNMSKKIAMASVKLLTRKMKKSDEAIYQLKKEVAGVKEMRDLSYAKGLTMDLCYSRYQKDCFIVDVHGGAWVYGDKKLNRHFCMHLAKAGYPVCNINYRLVPEVTLKEQIQDLFRALHYLKQHQREYGFFQQKLCLCGDSAGAHLVSLAACIMKDEELKKAYEVTWSYGPADYLLLQHGIYDLTPLLEGKKLYLKKFNQWMFSKEKVIQDKHSIYHLINQDWKTPIFLLSSEQDTMFCSQTITFAKKLEEYHIPHVTMIWDSSYQQLSHVFPIAHPDYEESQESIQQMIKFLEEQ